MTLFIDTHREIITVAIIDKKVFEISKTTNHEHSKYTLELISNMLKKYDYDKKDIKEIIVVNGPGSFTGVRIGVVIAKTLAYTLNIQIKTITSLEAFGESEESDFDIITAQDPKGYYFAKKKNGSYSEPEYLKKDDFLKMIEEKKFKPSYNKELNIKKIYDYMIDKPTVLPNSVNPIYVKRIMK